MTEHHHEFKKFQLVSSIDVDAGSIWIGDGCYVLKDSDGKRPADLGDDWHGICRRFFERSGYDTYQREWSRHQESWRYAWYDAPECLELCLTRPARPEGHTFDHKRPDDQKTDYDRHFERELELMDAFREKYMAENPFTPTAVDTGFASFQHDLGHDGMGVMVSTYYGDGSYPVYIEYGPSGRPRRVLIDFDPGADEEDEELLEAAE